MSEARDKGRQCNGIQNRWLERHRMATGQADKGRTCLYGYGG